MMHHPISHLYLNGADKHSVAGVIATTHRAQLRFVYLRLSAKLHVLHPLTVALKLCQCLPLHPLMQLHRLLQRLDPPLQVHLIADLTLVLEQT